MEKKMISFKNIILGTLLGAVFVYGLSFIETNDEKTVRLICAGASFLAALSLLFLSRKINLTNDFFRFLRQTKLPVVDPFHWLDAEGNLTPRSKAFMRTYYLIGCLAALGMGAVFLFVPFE